MDDSSLSVRPESRKPMVSAKLRSDLELRAIGTLSPLLVLGSDLWLCCGTNPNRGLTLLDTCRQPLLRASPKSHDGDTGTDLHICNQDATARITKSPNGMQAMQAAAGEMR